MVSSDRWALGSRSGLSCLTAANRTAAATCTVTAVPAALMDSRMSFAVLLISSSRARKPPAGRPPPKAL